MRKTHLPAVPALLAVCAAIAALAMPGRAAADDDRPLQARAWAAACASCHGFGGQPPAGSPIPPLAGRPAARIASLMADFKAGRRDGTVMPQIAKGYSEAQIAAIAAWFAAARPQGD